MNLLIQYAFIVDINLLIQNINVRILHINLLIKNINLLQMPICQSKIFIYFRHKFADLNYSFMVDMNLLLRSLWYNKHNTA